MQTLLCIESSNVLGARQQLLASGVDFNETMQFLGPFLPTPSSPERSQQYSRPATYTPDLVNTRTNAHAYGSPGIGNSSNFPLPSQAFFRAGASPLAGQSSALISLSPSLDLLTARPSSSASGGRRAKSTWELFN